MYLAGLSIENFKVFEVAEARLQRPGTQTQAPGELPNVNIFLGDNGGGKSSVLRAAALACLAPVLGKSGFVPYRLLRRPGAERGGIRASLEFGRDEGGENTDVALELSSPFGGDTDNVTPVRYPTNFESMLSQETLPVAFIAGYGATRRVETGDYSESQARRSRGLRYQRVASLFEDQITLVSFAQQTQRTAIAVRVAQAIDLLNATLPKDVQCIGIAETELMFTVGGVATPMASLSDGFRIFVGLVGDILRRLAELDTSQPLDTIPGIVLIDEIDVHLHPSWQRSVVPTLAKTFPRLQFLLTSHSALVAGSVNSRNVFLVDRKADGSAEIVQLDERTFGRTAEELLLSSYFGLPTTRAVSFQKQSNELFRRAAAGDPKAALQYLRSLSGDPDLAETGVGP